MWRDIKISIYLSIIAHVQCITKSTLVKCRNYFRPCIIILFFVAVFSLCIYRDNPVGYRYQRSHISLDKSMNVSLYKT